MKTQNTSILTRTILCLSLCAASQSTLANDGGSLIGEGIETVKKALDAAGAAAGAVKSVSNLATAFADDIASKDSKTGLMVVATDVEMSEATVDEGSSVNLGIVVSEKTTAGVVIVDTRVQANDLQVTEGGTLTAGILSMQNALVGTSEIVRENSTHIYGYDDAANKCVSSRPSLHA